MSGENGPLRRFLCVTKLSMEECVAMRSLKSLAASIIAFSSPALAQDFDSDSTRYISDPLYLPLEGEIYGATGYSYGSTNQDIFNSTGARTDSVDINLSTLSQEVLYGLTDDFALHLNWGYGWRDVTRHSVAGNATERSSSGWSDPGFGLTYRLMDQRESPLTFDLRADYSPDAFPAKAATPDLSGTIARGGQSVDLGATLGHEGRFLTVAGVFDAHWYGPRDVVNQNSGDLTHSDSLWNYRLGLAAQARLSDAFSLNAGVGHTFGNDVSVFNNTSGLFHISRGGDVTDIAAALNYQFVPNTVVGSLGYQHNFYQTTNNVFPTSPADNNSIRNKDEDLVGVTVRYLVP
jgi:hypothetical protein